MNKREWMLQAALNAMSGGITELNIEGMGRAYDAIVAATPDDGWIEHRGEKPYPEGLVEVRFRNGDEGKDDADAFIWAPDPEDPQWDIVAWRPARA